jgi:hypothetical protein
MVQIVWMFRAFLLLIIWFCDGDDDGVDGVCGGGGDGGDGF